MSELIFQPVPYDVVTSAATGHTSVRSTNVNAPYNSKLLTRLQAIADKVYDGNMFDDGVSFGTIDLDRLQKLLTQIVIRFDNNPKYYLKEDYLHLIWYLCLHLAYLAESGSVSPGDLADLQAQLEALTERVTKAETDLASIQSEVSTLLTSFTDFYSEVNLHFSTVDADIETLKSQIAALEANPGQQLSAGSGISIENDEIHSEVTEDIQVIKTTIGGYKDGMTITAGTPVMEVLRTMLQTVLDVIAIAPSVSMNNYRMTGEYGTSVTSSLEINFVQGKFQSENPSEWSYSIPMNCGMTSIQGDFTWTVTPNKATTTVTFPLLQYKVYNGWKAITSANTVIPKLSDGVTDSSVTYTNTVFPTSASLKVDPYYKVYIGHKLAKTAADISETDIKAMPFEQGYLQQSTWSFSADRSGEGESIIIACPSGYKLTGVTDSMGVPLNDNFSLVNTMNVTCGGSEVVPYDIYLYPITNGATQLFKNLTFEQ